MMLTQAETPNPSNPPDQSQTPDTPIHPGATTTKPGIVVPRIALRKNLGNVRRWMEADNDIGRITGIRWLIKETTLREKGKKTSLVVVYLEDTTQADRVRLGGRWLRRLRKEKKNGEHTAMNTTYIHF
ncbi:hypothetical protein BDZ91DRAFT_753091 [Kalaharituber pfeilii]|nr:hypothetical protein BDZ91DRAFT_753091 [Kalaharituber pfeilii]